VCPGTDANGDLIIYDCSYNTTTNIDDLIPAILVQLL
jgi:hypothetical protein